MANFFVSNILSMVWTNTGWTFDKLEWVPKRVELKIIQEIYTDVGWEHVDTIITSSMIPSWANIDDYIPDLPLQYKTRCIKDNESAITDPETWSIELSVSYIYFTKTYIISFDTNQNSWYSWYRITYSDNNIEVPSVTTMVLPTSYSNNSTIQFYIWNTLINQITATAPDNHYMRGFTFESSWYNYLAENTEIPLSWNCTIYWVRNYPKRIDVLVDCNQWTVFTDSNDNYQCWLFRWIQHTMIYWDTSRNKLQTISLNQMSWNTTYIENATPDVWYKLLWISIEHDWSTTIVDNNNYNYSFPQSQTEWWLYTITWYIQQKTWNEYTLNRCQNSSQLYNNLMNLMNHSSATRYGYWIEGDDWYWYILWYPGSWGSPQYLYWIRLTQSCDIDYFVTENVPSQFSDSWMQEYFGSWQQSANVFTSMSQALWTTITSTQEFWEYIYSKLQ